MYPRTETPRQDPSTDESRPLLHRVFGHTEPDRDEDQHQPEDAVDGRAADRTELEDQAQPEDRTDPEDRALLEDHRDADEQVAAEREAVEDELRSDDTDDTDAPHDDHEPVAFDDSTDLKPGDAPVAPVTAIWSDDSARDFRDRWREAQLSFVDDPQKAADDTRALVNEAVEALTAALSSHREQLDSWPDHRDTEQYRVVVQRYRTFFERLLAI